MLIVGAGGLLLQMLDDLFIQNKGLLTCWADRPVANSIIKEKCIIISLEEEVKNYFKQQGNDFLVATGNPATRSMLTKKFQLLGGNPVSFISAKAMVSSFCSMGQGVVVLHGSIIEAGCHIANGVLINSNSTITHEANIDEFTEIGPGATIAGRVSVGKNCFIGTGASIIPGVSIGNNAIVGAGAVVLNNVIENDVVAGVPAKSIKK